jgi:hypothetical protein
MLSMSWAVTINPLISTENKISKYKENKETHHLLGKTDNEFFFKV